MAEHRFGIFSQIGMLPNPSECPVEISDSVSVKETYPLMSD